jgi:predicted dehydrogenase
VVAHLDPGHEQYGPVYAGEGGRDPALDPGGRALIRYENGVVASVFVSKLINADTTEWTVEVFCERGSVKVTEPGGVDVTTIATDPIGGRLVRPLDVPQYRRTDGSAAIAELLDLIERRASGDAATEGQSSPREARKTLAILLAILQSQHQGNVPIVAPFADAE